MTGVAVVLVVCGFVGLHLALDRTRWPETRAFVGGGGVLLLAYLAYNADLMGNPLINPYTLSSTFSNDNVGFGGHHTPEHALSNTYTSVTLLDAVLFGWPPGFAFLLVLLPFVLGTRDRWDYLFGGAVLSIAAAWFFYIDVFIMYGPRFWYEMTPLLVLLAARGVSLSIDRARAFSSRLRPSGVGQTLVAPAVVVTVVGLVVVSVASWWAPPRAGRPFYAFVPTNVRDLASFNSTDRRILDTINELDLHRAVVLVEECPATWWCYGSVFPENDPLLEGDVVFARDRGSAIDQQLRAHYPDRAFYRATYTQPAVVNALTAEAAGP
jgi:hypothetical protein